MNTVYTAPAAPASGATITLLDTTALQVGGGKNVVARLGGGRLTLSFWISHASATNGLKFYRSSDGTTWRLADQRTVDATATVSKEINYYVGMFADVKITYENSANTLTAWDLSMVWEPNDHSAGV